jgi:hypothetical protein
MMRRFTASITAATVAIAVGLVIASVAGAARAAEYENMQARASAQNSVAATEAELAAYKQRLEEAYTQLNLTYSMLQSQDAQAAAQSTSSDGTNVSAAVSLGGGATNGGATNVDAFASLTAAPVALAVTPSAQTVAPILNVAPRSTPPPLPTRAPTARPAATPQPAAVATRTPTGLYCWYDHDGKYVCEDHPQGQ